MRCPICGSDEARSMPCPDDREGCLVMHFKCPKCDPVTKPEPSAPLDVGARDQPLPEDDAIKAAHPLRSGRHDLYAEAMRLVGERHAKADLVELVNWLLGFKDALLERAAQFLTADQAEIVFTGGSWPHDSARLVEHIWDPGLCTHPQWNDGMPESEHWTCRNCWPTMPEPIEPEPASPPTDVDRRLDGVRARRHGPRLLSVESAIQAYEDRSFLLALVDELRRR